MLRLRLVASNTLAALKSRNVPTFRSLSSSEKGATAAEITARSGVNPEIFTKRKVVIYKPARSAMTQGRKEHSRPWKLM